MLVKLLVWCNAHKTIVSIFFTCISFLPLTVLALQWYSQNLGTNPFESLIATSGQWSIIFILLTLLPTPLRRWLCFSCRKFKAPYGKRISDWNFIIKCKKTFGNVCLIYALFHAWVYFYYELGWDFEEFLFDVKSRTFIAFGVVSLLGLIPLGLTSFSKIQKIMGIYWRRLHRSVYIISILMVVHYVLAVKATEFTPFIFAACLFVLLGYRLLVASIKSLRKPEDKGIEFFRSNKK